MQLIQLQSFFHEKNDAADSTAFFHSGGAWAERPQAAPPEWKKSVQLNQLHNFSWEKTLQLN